MFNPSLPLNNFPGDSDGKASAYNAGDVGLIPGPGRSPGEGNGNPLQYSCLENPMDREAWEATVHGVAKTRTWLNNFTFFLPLLTGRGTKVQRVFMTCPRSNSLTTKAGLPRALLVPGIFFPLPQGASVGFWWDKRQGIHQVLCNQIQRPKKKQ